MPMTNKICDKMNELLLMGNEIQREIKNLDKIFEMVSKKRKIAEKLVGAEMVCVKLVQDRCCIRE